EQDNVYKQFPQNVTTFTTYYPMGTTRINTYLCPSTDEVQSLSSAEASNGVRNYTMHYYANLGPVGTNSGTGVTYPFRTIGSQGGYSVAGPLVVSSPAGGGSQGYRITDIDDGSSNTILLGEISKTGWNNYRSWIRGWDNDSSGATVSGKNIVYAINST